MLFEASRLSKTFANGVAGLCDLSFSVEAGAFVSMVGPSGCGKSTALRLIAGLLEPDAGQIAWTPDRPDIGFVFQEPTLMPWADARANVRLPLDIAGVARGQAHARAQEALARVGLRGFEASLPRELSGGMKMRVSIARALVARPKLLLLDEPFAALDEITRARLNEDLLRLWREDGLTVIFVTHSVAESCALAERVLVLSPRPGRIVADMALPRHAERGRDFRHSQAMLAAQARVSDALAGAAT